MKTPHIMLAMSSTDVRLSSSSMRSRGTLALGICIVFNLLFTGCNKVVLPRFEHAQEARPTKIPLAVNLIFDSTLQTSTLDVPACGVTHTIPVGTIIRDIMVQAASENFASVTAVGSLMSPTQVDNPHDLTIQLSLVRQSFDAPARFGSQDTYTANVNFQLNAVYLDREGRALAQRPANFADRVNIWTPQTGSSASTCATQSLDGAIKDVAASLSGQVFGIIPSLFGKEQAPVVAAVPQAFGGLSPGLASSQPPAGSSLSFRTKLQDGNDDLILQGGEAVILHVEITNNSSNPIQAVTVDLSGTPVILEAFRSLTPLPLAAGSFQPGETKTTEIRGRLASTVQAQRGELVVSVIPSDGTPAGTHRILAAIQPGGGANTISKSARPSRDSTTMDTPRTQAPRTSPRNTSETQYFALIVGVDQYRDPWPDAHPIPSDHIAAMSDILKISGLFGQDHIRVLTGAKATRSDFEEALIRLAKEQMTDNAVLLLYFAGHSLVNSKTGRVYLVPYEGSPAASPSRLLSLHSLQKILQKIPAKLTLLVLDTPVTQYLHSTGTPGSNGSTPINWTSGLPVSSAPKASPRVIQFRRTKTIPGEDPARLLVGLLGRADANKDGQVTVAEWMEDLQAVTETSPGIQDTQPFSTILLAR